MFKVEFETDNAAFEELGVTAIFSILDNIKEEVAEIYHTLDIGDSYGGTIYDFNGNRVGQWDFTRET